MVDNNYFFRVAHASEIVKSTQLPTKHSYRYFNTSESCFLYRNFNQSKRLLLLVRATREYVAFNAENSVKPCSRHGRKQCPPEFAVLGSILEDTFQRA